VIIWKLLKTRIKLKTKVELERIESKIRIAFEIEIVRFKIANVITNVDSKMNFITFVISMSISLIAATILDASKD